jgi:hypothetical protein
VLLGELHDWRFTFPAHGAQAITISLDDVANDAAIDATAWLVDLAGVRLLARISQQQRLQDLAMFAKSLAAHHVSNTVRLRSLHSYLRSAHLPTAEWKSIWRSIKAEIGGRGH